MTLWDKLRIFALPIAVVLAAVILVTGLRPHPRWGIAATTSGVYLLDRVSGAVFACENPNYIVGRAEVNCDPK